MAFDGTGVFAAPANSWNPTVDGTEVDASDFTDLLTAIVNGLTATVCKNGESTCSARIPFAAGASFFDGTVSAPGWCFSSDTNNGAYRIGADNWAISCGGTKVLEFTSAGITTATYLQTVIGPTPAAGASGYASFRLPHGAAPTTNLTNGDMWTTTTGLFVQLNGTTTQFTTITEGTWTPADNSGAGLSLTISKAVYRKIGNTVWLQAAITYPATADTSTAALTGLPFTVPSGAAANRNFFRIVRGTDANSIVGEFVDGTSALIFRTAADTSVGPQNSGFSSKAVAFTAVYSVT